MWWWTDSPCWDCRHGRACGTVDVVAGAAVVHGDDGMGIAVVAAVVGVDGRTCCLVTLSLCYSLSLSVPLLHNAFLSSLLDGAAVLVVVAVNLVRFLSREKKGENPAK